MKALILSCNTGEGHNSVAKALGKYLEEQNVECTVADTLSFLGTRFSKTISDFYVYSTKNSIFKNIYRFGSLISSFLENTKSPVYTWNKLYSRKLYDYILDNKFDVIVCVHLFPAEAMTALKINKDLSTPVIFIMTDYTCIPFLEETELDGYVIPHEHLIEEFAQNGIPRKKLYPFGIPVDKVFHNSASKLAARHKVAETFGWDIPEWHNWFLVMTGSMGFGNTQEIIDETIKQSLDDTEIITVCGRNEKMLNRLNENNHYIHTVHTIGYTDQISLLMDACDVLFTKPGGISSTEAISKHIPIIHTAPIPGCETRNAEFFHYHGMSYSTTDPVKQVQIALQLCHDKKFRKTMTGAQRLNARPDTCQNILNLITDQVS